MAWKRLWSSLSLREEHKSKGKIGKNEEKDVKADEEI